MLVRLTGCQMRCSWCDTEYAFHGGAWQTLPQVLATVAAFGCPLVEVTGGEPLLQPACLPLLTALCDAGYEVLLETGGGLDIAPVDPRVRRILDIKCPASGESGTTGGRTSRICAPPTRSSLSWRIGRTTTGRAG